MTSHIEDASRTAWGGPVGRYPLTREQEAIWLNDAFTEGRSRYTALWAHPLSGDVDPDAVEAPSRTAIKQIVDPDSIRRRKGRNVIERVFRPARQFRVVEQLFKASDDFHADCSMNPCQMPHTSHSQSSDLRVDFR
ncbi:hypothetical protein ACIQPR_47680 [Streptomyces sp. NPDC091280]|uniref:hypothetical protein n=1 Tax=Streptomyces sp. NPDC091280 TaxID=3365984 RepID=UPI00382983CD